MITRLLNALEKTGKQPLPSTATGKPSTTAIAFLQNLEDTDPNSLMFTEGDDVSDQTNEGWGHYQYTAAGLNMRAAITSWVDVGEVVMAQKLLAAGIKTCKVARELCRVRGRATQTYMADHYLSQLVEHLWECLPPVLKVIISNSPDKYIRLTK
jgi:hypothetical protein